MASIAFYQVRVHAPAMLDFQYVRRAGLVVAMGLAECLAGAAEFTVKDRQPTPEELATLPAVTASKVPGLLKDVKAPSDFEVTIFATPPAVNYPVFVAAAPDGTLYVSSDGNGSLDRKPHMGRVLRVRDLDGDGQADEVKAFVPDVDSPRGLVWDHDRLYLLHPPDISVFIDHNGDGVFDEKKTLIHGIGWTFKDRPADHASNGLEMGVDGWLYAAIGDFGFMEAVGTDGKRMQLRGGGVVRLRPDGTRMELWANGTRNILEVAMSPLLDGFARDNTNDGGGWDIRFHHFSGLTQHGYPRLFKNFPDEIITPLADYGGGSGCGAAWIDEPGIPDRWRNAPFTADWGRDWIYHHGVTPKGATYSATQEEFVRLPRVTDLDVDARSAVYAASWRGASFTWVGPDVGFIARMTPKGYAPAAVPDFGRLELIALCDQLRSPSHRTRLAAQRELVRRHALKPLPSKIVDRIRAIAASNESTASSRVAAIFALELALGPQSVPSLVKLSANGTVVPWTLRALGDLGEGSVPAVQNLIQDALRSRDPVIRKEAIIAALHAGGGQLKSPMAAAVAGLLDDSDPIVSHTAVQALILAQGWEACLSVLKDSSVTDVRRAAAARVLQSLPQKEVVDGLMSQLEQERQPARRFPILTALCRLHFVEGPWKGDSWGTRPDTRGPLYQPEAWAQTARIDALLKSLLQSSSPAEAAFIGRELSRHRIPAGEALEKLLARANEEPALLPSIAAQLADADEVPSVGVPLLIKVAQAEGSSEAVRAQAVIALAKTRSEAAWRALLQEMPRVQKGRSENNLAERAQSAVRNAPGIDQVHGVLETVAAEVQGPASQLAEGLLLRVASRKVGAPEARESARRSQDEGWGKEARRLQILRASMEARDTSRAAQIVEAMQDSNPEIARVARDAVKQLKIDVATLRSASTAAKIADLKTEEVLQQIVSVHGTAARGEQVFGQVGCGACHTVRADEPVKGPFLGTIANVYRRRELAEAILIPSKTIAQGFVAQHFELKDGSEVDGFVVREAATEVTVRTITAQEQNIPVSQVLKRAKQERSLMPEGLAASLTISDFASLLDYIESLPKQK